MTDCSDRPVNVGYFIRPSQPGTARVDPLLGSLAERARRTHL
jgi:hypothetical protein